MLSRKKLIIIGLVLAVLGAGAYVTYWQVDKKVNSDSKAADTQPAAAPVVAAARRAGFIRKRETLSANNENSILSRSDMPPNAMSNLVSSSGVLANASIKSIIGDRSIPRSV